MIPESCRAAVFLPDEAKLEIREFPLRAVHPDEILVRITLSTICGSDLHTITGKRHPRGPIILGHEICGIVAALGENITSDYTAKALHIGDRITWSIMASCGSCFFCNQGIPQKCEKLYKYGHESIDIDPPLNGGFAEYIYLKKGTAVFRLNQKLPDSTVVFANCSLATVTAAIRMARVKKGDTVLVNGAGLLGLCTAAICSTEGAIRVVLTDILSERLELAQEFGATDLFDVSQSSPDTIASELKKMGGIRGFDAAIEVCGNPRAIEQGIGALRIGGRYVIAGVVFPGTNISVDPHKITTRLLSVKGLHNYTPEDLNKALEFLEGPGKSFPFKKIVAKTYSLKDIHEAVESAGNNRSYMRVAITP